MIRFWRCALPGTAGGHLAKLAMPLSMAEPGAAAPPESRDYRGRVSTSVVLAVTPKQPIDPDRYMGAFPADVAAALLAGGQAVQAGLWSNRSGPCRMLFKI